MWLAHQQQFKMAWHLEEDTFFTGRWSQLFGRWASAEPTSDLIARFEPLRPGWNYAKLCRVSPNLFGKANASCYRSITSKTSPFARAHGITTWPALRMSVKLARAIVNDLRDGACGHHEALTSVVCAYTSSCKMSDLVSSVASTYAVAGAACSHVLAHHTRHTRTRSNTRKHAQTRAIYRHAHHPANSIRA